ncbi:hypothetical protein [Algoriphagus marinus]|uniref:hypothetical protein n=1 Tax=Algoriphagus marinus TaxID=1925762 RepID=UPI000A7E3422|nr:hypothetical protein [Algoriphagus marinus]
MAKNSSLNLSGRSIVLLVCLFIFFNMMLKQTMPPSLVLDLKFAYSASEAYQALDIMGEEMRKDYIKCLLIFDIPYMLIYTLLFIQLFNFLWKGSQVRLVCVGVLVFDFFENLMIYSMIQIFPDYSSFLGFGASFFTSTKWVFVGIMVALSLIGALKKIFSHERQGLL